jgi:hypothetical protein
MQAGGDAAAVFAIVFAILFVLRLATTANAASHAMR